MVGIKITSDQSSPLKTVPLAKSVARATSGLNSSAIETGYGKIISDKSSGLKFTSKLVLSISQKNIKKNKTCDIRRIFTSNCISVCILSCFCIWMLRGSLWNHGSHENSSETYIANRNPLRVNTNEWICHSCFHFWFRLDREFCR